MFKWLHKNKEDDWIDLLLELQASKLQIAELAIEKAIGMIANVIAKSEIKVIRNENGKLKAIKDANYIALNLKPNPRQTGTEFWHQAIRMLLREGEVVIVQINNYLYVVDSYQCTDKLFVESVYSDVCIDGLQLYKTFSSKDVIHIRNPNKKVKEHISAFNQSYAEMLNTAMSGYKHSNAPKYKLNVPSAMQMRGSDEETKKPNEYAKYLEGELSGTELKVILMGQKMELEHLANATSKSADDMDKIASSIFKITASAFNIPESVFNGSTTEKSKAFNDFIALGVSMYFELLDDALNVCFVEDDELKKGERIQIDQSRVKHVDILDAPAGLDKLFAVGWTHNNLQQIVGGIEVDEDWANTHFVTKNYTSGEDVGKEENIE